MRASVLFACGLIALAACRAPSERDVTAEADARLDAPASWTAEEDGRGDEPVPEAWWRSFDSPELDALVGEALAANRDLDASAARLDAALAQAAIAGADRWPTVSGGLSAIRQRQNFVGFPVPGGGSVLTTQSTNVGASLDLSWEVDLWGRVRAGRDAASSDARAASEELRAAGLSIAGQTSKTWFALGEARQQVELARRTVTSFEDNAEFVRGRYQRGLAPSLELRLTLSNAAEARAALRARERGERALVRQLEILLGRYPAGSLEPPAELPELPGEVPTGLPSQLLERRPDLAAARARVLASDRRLDQARASLLPSLRLTAGVGRAGGEFSDLFDDELSVWSLAGGLTAPLFEGGRLRAGVDLAGARTREALADYARLALRAFSEVETALETEQHLARREVDLREAADQAQAAEELARDRYRSGVEDLLVVFDAQRRTVIGESQWLAVRRERLENRIDLLLALGGGFGDETTEAALTAQTEEGTR